MKKLIYCALALAAGLFAASCQQENLEPVAQENTVTFTVELPGVATKAIGDGSNVNELIYEVWKTGETGEIDANSTRLYQKTLTPLAEGVARKWIVSLNLVQDQTYKVLFWAQVAKPENHENYDTDNLTAVTYAAKIAKDYSANQEDYAAFYGTKVLNTRIPLKGETIILTRPFAQLNIATDNDVEEYTVTMKTSKVTVAGVPTFFNVATSLATVPETITFDTFAVPTEDLEVASRTEPYDYVAMNYVFASKTGIVAKVSYDINSTLTAKNLDGNNGATTDVTISNVIPNVPLQENFRTNIIGNLLSSTTQYEIEIDARFQSNGNDDMEAINDGLVENINGDYEISTAAGFAYAINNLFADGGTFYIHPGKYDFTGLTVVPQPTNPGVILNVKANEVPVVTRSTTPEFEIIGLDVDHLVSEVKVGSQALFSGLVLPENTKLVGTNNGVVGISGCSNEVTNKPAELVGSGNGTVVNTVSMASVDEINDAIAQGLKLIELTRDVTEAKILSLTSSVIIDGNGYTWTYTGSDRAITAENNVSNIDIIIKNFNLELSAGYCQRGINFNVPDGTLTIENVKVSANEEYTPATYAINLPGSSDNSRVTIKDSHIRGNIALNVWGENMRINATNTEFVSYDGSDEENYSAIVLNNDGSTFANETVVNINGGKIIALDENGEESYAIRNSTMTGQVIVSETTEVVGTVSNPVAVVVYEGYNEFYSFTTLQQAIDKVCEDNNGSVRLIKGITVSETVVVPADETVVIDLNGKTLNTVFADGSTTNHIYAFTNNGTLTLKNGTINTRGIFNYGKMTLESGTINAIDGNGGYGVRNYPGAEFIMNGGTIATTLEDDNKVNNGGYDATTLRVDEGASAIINGGNINNICDYTFALENYGTTTVNGGILTSIHTTVANYGTLNVAGGSFTINGLEGVTAHALWAAAGTTTINGGTFDGKDNYNGFNVDASEGAVVNITGGKFLPVHSGSLYGKGTINVTGGEFFDDPSARVAEGYKAVEKGGIYTVIPANYTLVSTADELVAALGANQNVLFANNITVAATKGGYSKAGILQNKAQTIDGNGYTLTVTGAGATWDCAIYTNGGTIKNLTVAGAMRGIFTAGTSADIYIENVIFKNVIYTFNSDGGNNNYGVYLSNCTINGWTSHSDVHKEVVYTNCSFGEGSGYKFCRPYGKTSFVECTFCSGYTVDESMTNDITYTNCVFN